MDCAAGLEVSRAGRRCKGPVGAVRCRSYFGFDDDQDEDSNLPYDPRDWDEPEEADEFDPEPLDDEIWNDFEPGEEPEEDEAPPDELWTDSDWE